MSQQEQKKPRTFVTSDSHGMREELQNCLDQASFDKEVDTLIHLGDCVDRGPDSKGVIDLLLSMPKLIAIRGNHDDVLWNWTKTGVHKLFWMHGGTETITSYIGTADRAFTNVDIPKEHIAFLENQLPYYVDDQNRCFVHGGFSRHKLLKDQDKQTFYWDRDLFYAAYAIKDALSPETHVKLDRFHDLNGFDRIFVGHTPTVSYYENLPLGELWLPGRGTPITKPIYLQQLVNIDTGSCFGGKLSLLDITDDKEHILYQA